MTSISLISERVAYVETDIFVKGICLIANSSPVFRWAAKFTIEKVPEPIFYKILYTFCTPNYIDYFCKISIQCSASLGELVKNVYSSFFLTTRNPECDFPSSVILIAFTRFHVILIIPSGTTSVWY